MLKELPLSLSLATPTQQRRFRRAFAGHMRRLTNIEMSKGTPKTILVAVHAAQVAGLVGFPYGCYVLLGSTPFWMRVAVALIALGGYAFFAYQATFARYYADWEEALRGCYISRFRLCSLDVNSRYQDRFETSQFLAYLDAFTTGSDVREIASTLMRDGFEGTLLDLVQLSESLA